MPENKKKNNKTIVINTGPILALTAAWGKLDILKELYAEVIVPFEVCREILAAGPTGFAINEFQQARWMTKLDKPSSIPVYLAKCLDPGEASVIHTANETNNPYVCIDETAGRRIARLHDLKLTGSVGVLVRAIKEGFNFSITDAIGRMKQNGVWLSKDVVAFALNETKDLQS